MQVSILTVIELGLPVSESSTKISKFYAPTDSEHKFHKAGIESERSIELDLRFPQFGNLILLINTRTIKAGWRDNPLALRDFSQSNKQKLSANAGIGLHSHPHFHQLIISILSCGVKLFVPPQLFSSSITKCFLGIAL